MQQCLQPLVSQRPPPSGARPVCHGGHQRSPRVVATSASYTAVDSKLAFRTFSPQVLNVDNLLAGEGANVGQIRQVRGARDNLDVEGYPLQRSTSPSCVNCMVQVQQECAATGFLAIQGHGIPAAQLQQLFATAKQLFDLPLQDKMRLTVQDMQAGRGFEISPEHKSYMQVCLEVLLAGSSISCGPTPNIIVSMHHSDLRAQPALPTQQKMHHALQSVQAGLVVEYLQLRKPHRGHLKLCVFMPPSLCQKV